MTSAHLDTVTWERLAMRELPDGERQAALDHLLQCARCTAIYRSVLALEESARSQGLGPAPSPMRRWRPIGLAAALAAAAAFFAFWLAPRRIADDAKTLRGGPSAEVELLPAATGPSGVPSFSWARFGDDAMRYRVSLFTEDGRPVWTREVEAPPLRWPDDVPRTAGRYRWRVEALAKGAVVARSRLADLEIAR